MMSHSAGGTQHGAPAIKPVGWVRWGILIFIFLATTLNYIDRFTIAILKGPLQTEFGWNELDYADIVFFFSLAYALGYVFFGRLIDYLGAKRGYIIAVVVWTTAQIGCAFAGTKMQFQGILFMLGLGESGNFPAALKTVANWFPQRERSFATGLFNAGSNVGAILTPILVLLLLTMWGWPAAFIGTGALSLIWLTAWIVYYRDPRDHKSLSRAELEYIESDRQPPVKSLPWLKLFPVKETWAFAIPKFLTDMVWWFYLFWLPSIFVERFHLEMDIKKLGLPIIIVYLISDLGSIFGGWMSSAMIKRGFSVNRSRKLTMLLCALGVLPVWSVIYTHDVWFAVGIFGLAAAAHQAFSANLFTIPSDTMPKIAVASVVGIGGTAGAVGGILLSRTVGLVRDYIGDYTPILIAAGVMYLTALLILHILSPKLELAKVPEEDDGKTDYVMGGAVALAAISGAALVWSILFKLADPLAALPGLTGVAAPADPLAAWAALLGTIGFVAGIWLAIAKGRAHRA